MLNEPVTVQEAVEKWDKGELLHTMEMGGMGPGYEQAIQVAAIELIRAMMDRPLPDPVPDDWGDKELTEVNRRLNMGLSGAQAGAIKWLAKCAIKEGWAARNERFRKTCAEKGEQDRMIMISKHWPTMPEMTPKYMMLGAESVE